MHAGSFSRAASNIDGNKTSPELFSRFRIQIEEDSGVDSLIEPKRAEGRQLSEKSRPQPNLEPTPGRGPTRIKPHRMAPHQTVDEYR